MTDSGGSSSRYYKCLGASSGGICENKRSVREDVLVSAAIVELKRVLTDTSLRAQIQEEIAERLKSFKTENKTAAQQLERHLAEKRAEVERLVTFIRSTDLTASPGAFESVRASLEKATSEVRALELKLAVAKPVRSDAPTIPTVEEIASLVVDVEARIKEDPTGAREALRQPLGRGGRLYMEPLPDGSYHANSVLFPLRLYWRMRNRKPRSAEAAGVSRDVVGNVSCAGRI